MKDQAIPLQLFGSIGSEAGEASAMLCLDVDRSDEATLHWWGPKIRSSVVLVGCRREGGGALELRPTAVYRVDENGGFGTRASSREALSRLAGFAARLSAQGEGFAGEWWNENGGRGPMRLDPPPPTAGVSPEPCADWSAFKEWATRSREESDAVAYRGHGSNAFRLETSLHRAGRHRLERYCGETLLQFRDHAEAVLGMRFNLDDGGDYSMLLGLAQHHGLPTPLLDWSSSPYIAAFFAFASAVEFAEKHPGATHVRIYGLTRSFVGATSPPVVTLPRVEPYVDSLSISPRNNPRLYVQQGLFLVTNLADVEGFVCRMEKETGRPALVAADVPTECASEALEDLAFMGLTAASLYPGLDGVCRMLRHAMLFRRSPLSPAGKPAGGTG